ncbi:hypothetical protein R3P38DRAFT_3175501 [Favolaschia claudopus]|uniref:Uncharacterized protein n=1 Tax=Favolaschia claudopus TaxID=2862362 RepID=A0AAW0D329_9AGAR
MPSSASSNGYGDDEILERLANLSLSLGEDTAPPPPYPGTPRPRNPSIGTVRTAPHPPPGPITTPRNRTVYRYESPGRADTHRIGMVYSDTGGTPRGLF